MIDNEEDDKEEELFHFAPPTGKEEEFIKITAAVDSPLRERRICSGDVGMLSIGQINTCMAETAPSLPHAQTGNRRLTTPKARKFADAIGGAF